MQLEVQCDVIGPWHASSFIINGEQIIDEENMEIPIGGAVL